MRFFDAADLDLSLTVELCITLKIQQPNFIENKILSAQGAADSGSHIKVRRRRSPAAESP
jgi:hypothetical protein